MVASLPVTKIYLEIYQYPNRGKGSNGYQFWGLSTDIVHRISGGRACCAGDNSVLICVGRWWSFQQRGQQRRVGGDRWWREGDRPGRRKRTAAAGNRSVVARCGCGSSGGGGRR
uniref:Uncharacterized protein n=1 Tax=Oryza meridionalis TaxID=40149 RepID=A0A0E0DB16_9ORYZ